MTDTVRLANRVAQDLGCSKRDAENYVLGGWVSVDGNVLDAPGERIALTANVTLAEGARPDPVAPVTLLLNKPEGFGASAASETAAELFRPDTLADTPEKPPRVLSAHFSNLLLATPLETDACGLIVATQDHAVIRKLMDDASRIEQEFIVEVSGDIAKGGLALLNEGLSWQGKPLPAIKVSWQNETHLRFALKTPALGLIQYMCGQVGLTVVNVRRIRIGRLSMSALTSGTWRYLKGYERF